MYCENVTPDTRSVVTMDEVMKLHKHRDLIRAELVKALLMSQDTLPEEARALLIADQNATAEWAAAFTEYKGELQ